MEPPGRPGARAPSEPRDTGEALRAFLGPDRQPGLTPGARAGPRGLRRLARAGNRAAVLSPPFDPPAPAGPESRGRTSAGDSMPAEAGGRAGAPRGRCWDSRRPAESGAGRRGARGSLRACPQVPRVAWRSQGGGRTAKVRGRARVRGNRGRRTQARRPARWVGAQGTGGATPAQEAASPCRAPVAPACAVILLARSTWFKGPDVR